MLFGTHLEWARATLPGWRTSRIASALTALRAKMETRLAVPAAAHSSISARAAAGSAISVTTLPAASSRDADDSAFSLEDPSQFSMAWTTFEDDFRRGFPQVGEYCAAITDANEATRQFWLTLRSTALPYNLLVLQRLTDATTL